MTIMPVTNKKQDVSFYDPASEREAKRKRMIAEQLFQKGNTDFQNEQAGSMTVKRSPWEFLNKGLQSSVGQMQIADADKQEADLEKKRQQMIADALGKYGENPQQAAMILAQDPRTSEMAANVMKGEVDFTRQRQRQMEEDALRREQINAISLRGSSTPAPMQIAGKMFELEQAMNNPSLSENDRFLAQREYNLLGQAAKTYGFDRGIQATADMNNYNAVFNNQLPTQPQNIDQMAMSEAMLGTQQTQSAAPMPQVNQNMQALPQQQLAASQMPSNQPQTYQTPFMQVMPGYGDAASQIAAQKKRAESIASEEGKRIGEASGTLNFLESNMPKLEQVVSKLEDLSNKATYTTVGRAIDFARKESGQEPRESAIARAEYIATVDNEVLPLLRDTFGAAFTVKEGETLRNTLGDPDKSPAEKKAVLNAFISQKKSQIGSLQRQVGINQSSAPNQKEQIAVNPQTGERLINRGNGWEPMQ
jgi:hypothetical protein